MSINKRANLTKMLRCSSAFFLIDNSSNTSDKKPLHNPTLLLPYHEQIGVIFFLMFGQEKQNNKKKTIEPFKVSSGKLFCCDTVAKQLERLASYFSA